MGEKEVNKNVSDCRGFLEENNSMDRGPDELQSSLAAQTVKTLLATWETCVRFLGWEDPLEKETATYSSLLAWRVPWTEDPGRLQSMDSQTAGHD